MSWGRGFSPILNLNLGGLSSKFFLAFCVCLVCCGLEGSCARDGLREILSLYRGYAEVSMKCSTQIIIFLLK